MNHPVPYDGVSASPNTQKKHGPLRPSDSAGSCPSSPPPLPVAALSAAIHAPSRAARRCNVNWGARSLSVCLSLLSSVNALCDSLLFGVCLGCAASLLRTSDAPHTETATTRGEASPTDRRRLAHILLPPAPHATSVPQSCGDVPSPPEPTPVRRTRTQLTLRACMQRLPLPPTWRVRVVPHARTDQNRQLQLLEFWLCVDTTLASVW